MVDESCSFGVERLCRKRASNVGVAGRRVAAVGTLTLPMHLSDLTPDGTPDSPQTAFKITSEIVYNSSTTSFELTDNWHMITVEMPIYLWPS